MGAEEAARVGAERPEQEREGAVEFVPMDAGKLSLGVRQNRVHWFKGAIREVRVTPAALAEGALQRVKE